MSELQDVMAYILENYPDHMREELSNARLTKMVYLADWRHVLQNGRQITDIQWYFDNYGPFVRDIEKVAKQNPDLFSIVDTQNIYGQQKKKFTIVDENYVPKLTDSEKSALDHILSVTQKLFWNDFIKLVYSTHPIASSERYTNLDLASKAMDYRVSQSLESNSE